MLVSEQLCQVVRTEEYAAGQVLLLGGATERRSADAVAAAVGSFLGGAEGVPWLGAA